MKIVFDTETTGTNINDEILQLSISGYNSSSDVDFLRVAV